MDWNLPIVNKWPLWGSLRIDLQRIRHSHADLFQNFLNCFSENCCDASITSTRLRPQSIIFRHDRRLSFRRLSFRLNILPIQTKQSNGSSVYRESPSFSADFINQRVIFVLRFKASRASMKLNLKSLNLESLNQSIWIMTRTCWVNIWIMILERQCHSMDGCHRMTADGAWKSFQWKSISSRTWVYCLWSNTFWFRIFRTLESKLSSQKFGIKTKLEFA